MIEEGSRALVLCAIVFGISSKLVVHITLHRNLSIDFTVAVHNIEEIQPTRHHGAPHSF